MQFLRTKRLSVLFLLLAVLTQQQAHAGWADWFNPKSEIFQQQVIPKLKDWRTYAVLAGLGVATYFVAPEVYWGCKSALPFYRARDYVRSTFAKYVSNQEHLLSLSQVVYEKMNLHIANPDEEVEKKLFRKDVIDATCRPYRLYYEFSKIEDRQYECQPFRAPQSNENGVEVHDRSSLVRGQSGATCGMHSAFNASELYKYYTQQDYEHNIIDRLRQGPNIGEICQTLRTAIENEDILSNSLVGNWTERDAVHHLMTNHFAMSADSFTIMPTTEGYTLENCADLDEGFIPAVQHLYKQEGNCHAFILGNMVHIGDANSKGMSGTSGHWIAVLARKEGDSISLYVMDSLSSRNTQNAVVNHLGTLIRGSHDMSAENKLDFYIVPLIMSLTANLNNNISIEKRLESVEKIIKRAELLGLVQLALFQHNACGLIKGVLENISVQLNSNQTCEEYLKCQELMSKLDFTQSGSSSSTSFNNLISFEIRDGFNWLHGDNTYPSRLIEHHDGDVHL